MLNESTQDSESLFRYSVATQSKQWLLKARIKSQQCEQKWKRFFFKQVCQVQYPQATHTNFVWVTILDITSTKAFQFIIGIASFHYKKACKRTHHVTKTVFSRAKCKKMHVYVNHFLSLRSSKAMALIYNWIYILFKWITTVTTAYPMESSLRPWHQHANTVRVLKQQTEIWKGRSYNSVCHDIHMYTDHLTTNYMAIILHFFW